MSELLPLANRRCVRLADVPVLTVEELTAELGRGEADGARIVALFGMPETPRTLRMVAIIARDGAGALGVASAVVGRE